MIEVNTENVKKFRELVELAESGELQGAEDRVGPFNVNPYYYEDRRLVAAVGFFMNIVVPEAQDWNPEGEDKFTNVELGRRYREREHAVGGLSDLSIGDATGLADRAGYLFRVNDYDPSDHDTIIPVYEPTKSLVDIEQKEVFIGKNTLKVPFGCSTGLISGVVGGLGANAIVEAPEPYIPSYFILSGVFGGLGLGSWASMEYRNLKAGTEAYKYYSNQTNGN